MNSEDLVGVHILKSKLYLNRPIYVGFSILDISKTLMYDFHYNYIKRKFGSSARLLFTDTDSLAYTIQTDDFYKHMLEDSDLFDTSEYTKDSPLYNTKNKKVLGKMKDETYGNAIHAFVGLKSKMYAYTYDVTGEKDGKEVTAHVESKKAKGIKKYVIEKHTRFEQYKECLLQKKVIMSNMNQIRSYKHQLYNISQTKMGLSPFDDKRYLLDDGITSYAYGHWKIES
ncbi:hypothetical protein KP79_PYT25700 [Mizuhopecten yessoensis]|uniref:DNA-directed DNA polymerase n=1 Tax=Mizuhopecten yessoensis TaxID=6573 RepID=A0A210QMP2_MIZYE|nr:hypothetical protein KP79_PYT25700 [Mizuhopecten yessoensis]